MPSDTKLVFFHTDAIGSVRMVTSAQGAVLHRYDYSPDGALLNETGTGVPWNRRSWAGKERDVETASGATAALDYFGARSYAQQLGRFTAVGPGHVGGDVLSPQSWNGYAYSLNNSLRFIDPGGTCSQNASGDYADSDDAGTLVAPGPCKTTGEALTVGLETSVTVTGSSSGIAALAYGVSRGSAAVADPKFIAGFYAASALYGGAVAMPAGAALVSASRLGPLVLTGQLGLGALSPSLGRLYSAGATALDRGLGWVSANPDAATEVVMEFVSPSGIPGPFKTWQGSAAGAVNQLINNRDKVWVELGRAWRSVRP